MDPYLDLQEAKIITSHKSYKSQPAKRATFITLLPVYSDIVCLFVG